jgi:hypothetical protein
MINRKQPSQLSLNTPEYFGYKRPQWLPSNTEADTIAVAKKDENTGTKKLHIRLKHTDLQFHTSGLKTTYSAYTVDVLMEVIRNDYISPWNAIFGNDASVPRWLGGY